MANRRGGGGPAGIHGGDIAVRWLSTGRGRHRAENRQAKTPADHQALAAWYAKEAQTAQQLASRYFVMREVLAAARAVERKDRAGEHWAFVAKKYQEMAKEDEILAAVHKMMAEQRQ